MPIKTHVIMFNFLQSYIQIFSYLNEFAFDDVGKIHDMQMHGTQFGVWFISLIVLKTSFNF